MPTSIKTRTATCSRCGQKHAVRFIDGQISADACRPKGERADAKNGSITKHKGRSHYNAKATVCENGHRHGSKVEARVCTRVFFSADPLPVYLRPRIPCFCVGPDPAGLPCYVTPDFVVTTPNGELRRIVDAKSGRKRSPEWKRGRAMLERQTGLQVEELSC